MEELFLLSWTYSDIRFWETFFEITYETLSECLFRASKDDYPENDRIIIDNQDNQYVDAYAQGALEYMKANRLGNEQLIINQRVLDKTDAIKIGDYYIENGDKYIIYRTDYKSFSYHTDVNAYATKNYILRNYYTGIKSKIRLWGIADSNDGVIRNDIRKYYLYFDYRALNEIVDENIKELSYQALTPLYDYEENSLNYAIVKCDWNNTEYGEEESYDYYSMELIKRIVGHSLVFSCGFEDNASAGKYVDINKSLFTEPSGLSIMAKPDLSLDNNFWNVTARDSLGAGALPMKDAIYVNKEGELNSMFITIIFFS